MLTAAMRSTTLRATEAAPGFLHLRLQVAVLLEKVGIADGESKHALVELGSPPNEGYQLCLCFFDGGEKLGVAHLCAGNGGKIEMGM